MANDRALQDLLEMEEIREVIGPRYARGMDWHDLEMLKSCFHPDATLDYGYFKGNAHEWCERRIVSGNPAELHRFHYCFPAHVEMQGEVAHSESNSFAGYRTKDDAGEQNVYFGARYFDTLQRRNGVWKIALRVVQIDFTQTLPVPGDPVGLQKGLPFLIDPSPVHPLYRRLYTSK